MSRCKIINKEDYPMVLDWSNYKNTKTKLLCKCQGCSRIVNKSVKLLNKTRDCYCYNCGIKIKRSRTNLEKYGVENPFQSEQIKEKIKQTNLERYGVENVSFSNEILEKKKINNIEKWGIANPLWNNKIQNKIKEKNLKKYGFEYYNNREKAKKTCIEKYNVENISQLIEVKNKKRNTCLNKYGVNNPTQLEGIKEKAKQTNIKKYGVEHPLQNKDILIKQHISKKKNNSYGKSKYEDYIYLKLITKFNKVERQYISNMYPYSCDFYISEINLFIEYQSIWTHGVEPFNKNNIKHQNILKEWKKKSKNSEYYKNAINVWTITDIDKRTIAKEKNLKWFKKI